MHYINVIPLACKENSRPEIQMAVVNPVIGSGFDESRGSFAGDYRSSSQSVHHNFETESNDHPFHNVDHNTMMAMRKALVVLQKVKGDNSVHQIADRLYLGSIGAALNLPELQSVGITHILCTATGVRSMHPDKFSYKTLTVLDSQSESLIDHFADSIHWIECALRERPLNKILVHCFAGRSRSVAIILAYLVYKLRIPLSVALLHVRQFRASANPNIGFINQLKAFEQELFQSLRSFAFDTLFDDLSSLIPGAKERLKHIRDGRVSVSPQDRMRPSSALSSPVVSRSVSSSTIRAKSTDPSVMRGLRESIETLEIADYHRIKLRDKPWVGICMRWIFVWIFVLLVVGLESISFPYYSQSICNTVRPMSVMASGICNQIPVVYPARKLERELAHILNQTLHVLSHVVSHFPQV